MIIIANMCAKSNKIIYIKVSLRDESKTTLHLHTSSPYLSLDYMLMICKPLGNLDVLSPKKPC